jgi:hypothetical protein
MAAAAGGPREGAAAGRPARAPSAAAAPPPPPLLDASAVAAAAGFAYDIRRIIGTCRRMWTDLEVLAALEADRVRAGGAGGRPTFDSAALQLTASDAQEVDPPRPMVPAWHPGRS